jgi:hypothetical protein
MSSTHSRNLSLKTFSTFAVLWVCLLLCVTAMPAPLQADINCKTTFSFFVQYNKSGTNQQGYAEFDITSYYKVDGTLDTVKHTTGSAAIRSRLLRVIWVTAPPCRQRLNSRLRQTYLNSLMETRYLSKAMTS